MSMDTPDPPSSPPPGPEPPLASDPVARDILRGVTRLLIGRAEMPIAEFTLPNGRRADIAALARDGTLSIVEIKSSIADFRSDQKWPEYRAFCDRLFFAVTPGFPNGILPPDCGLILADRYGGEIVREPEEAPRLNAGRRKALTLRFARTAALRLAAGIDPEIASRPEAKDV